jgi:hypothetical protein
MVSRAPETSRSASMPFVCSDDGLPYLEEAISDTREVTSSYCLVVALLSRYISVIIPYLCYFQFHYSYILDFKLLYTQTPMPAHSPKFRFIAVGAYYTLSRQAAKACIWPALPIIAHSSSNVAVIHPDMVN